MGHLRKLWKSAHTFLLPALLYSCSTATLQILLVSPWGSVTMRISDRQPSWCRKVCFQLPDFSPLNYHGCHSRSLDCRGPCTVHWCKLPPPRTPERRPTPPSTSGYRSEVEWPHRRWSPQRWSRPELAGRWWQDPINVPTPHLKRVPLPWSAGVTAEPSPPQCKNNPFSQTTVDLLSSGRLVSFTELPRLVHHRSARQRWYSRARPVRLNCPGEITSRRCTPHARRLPLRFLEARAHKKNGNTDLRSGFEDVAPVYRLQFRLLALKKICFSHHVRFSRLCAHRLVPATLLQCLQTGGDLPLSGIRGTNSRTWERTRINACAHGQVRAPLHQCRVRNHGSIPWRARAESLSFEASSPRLCECFGIWDEHFNISTVLMSQQTFFVKISARN